MKLSVRYLLSLVAVLSTLWVQGQTTYYFSSANGNDANAGTNASSPFRSMVKLQQLLNTMHAGDKVLFERGSVWYEVNLMINQRVATSSQPIVFDAYGSGSRPVLSGGKLLEGFTRNGSIHSIGVLQDFPHGNINVPGGILLDGVWHDIARSEERIISGSNSTRQLSDYSQNWQSNEYAGAYIFIQSVLWQWESRVITSNTSNTLYFSDIEYPSRTDKKTPYYLANSDKYLQTNGDWTFRNRMLRIYYDGDLESHNVQFSVVDSIIGINESEHIQFKNLVFEMSNYRHISMRESDHISITDCELRYTAGGAVRCYRTDNIVFNRNYVHDCGAMGMRINMYDYLEIRNNRFCRIATQHVGMCNYDFKMGCAISIHNSMGRETFVQYNHFDSVGAAVQTYTFRENNGASISYNYVEDYGVTVADCGAFYSNSDVDSDTRRYIKNNIILDSKTAGNRFDINTLALHPHGIYMDEVALSYICDSNSIENTSVAFYSNRNYKNCFKNNNVVNAHNHLPNIFSTAFLKDQAIGIVTYSADRDTIRNNKVVFGDNAGTSLYLRHTTTAIANQYIDQNNFYYDYNMVASPFFSTEPVIGKYVWDWQADHSFTLAEMRYNGGEVLPQPSDLHSRVNPQGIMYSQVSGQVSKEDFVKFFTNFSAQRRVVNLGSATFRDMEGNQVSGSTTIPPFYSKILFYQSGDIRSVDPERYVDSALVPALLMDQQGYTNNPPRINSVTFIVNEGEQDGTLIGTLHAYDPDYGQAISYSIESGNTGGLFSIDNAGHLRFTTNTIPYSGNPTYSLTVRVTDNGSPVQSATAVIQVQLHQSVVNHAPLIEDQEFIYRVSPEGDTEVGIVTASDPDEDEITYSIVANTADELYAIDPGTGMLRVNAEVADVLVPQEHQITVEVVDNGNPQEANQAVITIRYIPAENIVYIDPDNSLEGDGSFENPFSNLSSVSLQSGYMYLLKRGTHSEVTVWNINADNIIVGAYGQGAAPVISSTTGSYVVRISDRDRIVIQDIAIQASGSLGGFYLSNTKARGIQLSNCSVKGGHYGIRALDVDYLQMEYCSFSNTIQAGFIVADEVDVNYSIFESNTLGLNIISNGLGAMVLNNLFINNRDAITFTGDYVLAYNNIFYLSQESDRALICNAVVYSSDHNLYYPIRSNFCQINNIVYSSIDELRSYQNSDYKSVSSDPLFQDQANKNYTLLAKSPGIDGGTYVGLQYDIHGRPIPEGAAPDIGVVESSGMVTDLENAQVQSGIVEGELYIYPNPVDSELHIQLPDSAPGSAKGSLSIYDVTGHLIHQVQLGNLAGSTYTIGTERFQPGIYLVKFYNGDASYMGRFLKAN